MPVVLAAGKIRKICVALILAALLLTGCAGGAQPDNPSQKGETDPMELTLEYVLNNSDLTAADFEGVDFADFVAQYELTQESLEEYDIAAVLAMYKRGLAEPEAVDYTVIFDKAEGTLKEEDLSRVTTVVWEQREGNGNITMVIDGETGVVYYGYGDFLESCTEDVKTGEVTGEDLAFVRQALSDSGITGWNESYIGTNEGTTETASWDLGIRLEDGRCFHYNGRGVLDSGTPQQLYTLLDTLAEYFRK